MKKFYSVAAIFLIGVLMSQAPDMVGEAFSSQGLWFESVKDNGGNWTARVVASYSGSRYSQDEIIVPATVESRGTVMVVTAIGKDAFTGCENLRKISIAEGVKVIGDNNFTGCPKLEKVLLPSGLIEIGGNCFSELPSLGSIVLPEGLTDVGSGSFCSLGVSHLELGSIREIPQNSFCNLPMLKSLVVPASVGVIESGAVSDTGIEEVWFESAGSSQEKMLLLTNGSFRNNKALRRIYCRHSTPPRVEGPVSADFDVTPFQHNFPFRTDNIQTLEELSALTLYVPTYCAGTYSYGLLWERMTIAEHDFEAGLDSADADCAVRVDVVPGGVSVSATGSRVPVRICTISGMEVYSAENESGNIRCVLPSGIYVVKAGDSVRKVSIR